MARFPCEMRSGWGRNRTADSKHPSCKNHLLGPHYKVVPVIPWLPAIAKFGLLLNFWALFAQGRPSDQSSRSDRGYTPERSQAKDGLSPA